MSNAQRLLNTKATSLVIKIIPYLRKPHLFLSKMTKKNCKWRNDTNKVEQSQRLDPQLCNLYKQKQPRNYYSRCLVVPAIMMFSEDSFADKS